MSADDYVRSSPAEVEEERAERRAAEAELEVADQLAAALDRLERLHHTDLAECHCGRYVADHSQADAARCAARHQAEVEHRLEAAS